MGLQRYVDKFDSQTPRKKAGTVVIVILVMLIIAAALIGLGTYLGHQWADSKFLQEREQRLQQMAVLQASADQHAANEQKLAAQNEQLKQQNEAAAEILAKNDAKIAGDAQKFADDLKKQREQKENEIQNTSDADTRAGLCADAKSAGFNLSFCK
jgi:uncharacterized protein HemX